MKLSRNKLRLRRKKRISAKIKGAAKRPRMAIFKSLRNLYVQVIDDQKGNTLASINSQEIKVKNDIQGAKEVGTLIAKKCQEKKITQVVFDRSGYKYHGKVKALAESAKKNGLKI